MNFGGTKTGTDAQTCGVTKEALTPASRRNNIMVQKFGAKPHKNVEMVKAIKPVTIHKNTVQLFYKLCKKIIL